MNKQLEIDGMVFPEGVDELHGRLWWFGRGECSVGKRYEHLVRAVDLAFNVSGSLRRVVWNSWLEETLVECIGDGSPRRYLGVAGCSSSGKSDGVGLYGFMRYWARPSETYVIVMSTTKQMARKRVWKSINQFWLQGSRMGCPGEMVESQAVIRGINVLGKSSADFGIELVAADKTKASEASGKIMGVKAPALIVIADELPDLADNILPTVVGNIASNPEVFFAGMGNPNLYSDPHGLLCEPVEGWRAVNEGMRRWRSKYGTVLRFDAEQSPRIVNKDERLWWQPDEEYVRSVAERGGGRRSRLYYRFVKGFWCPEGVGNSVYAESEFLMGRALEQVEPRWDSEPMVLSSLDPAFTHGGDRSVVMMAKLGKVDGRSHLHVFPPIVLEEDVTKRDEPLSFQTVDRWKALCGEWDCRPVRAVMDGTGAGISFGHIVDARWSPAVTKVNFGAKASERPVSLDGRADWQFYNKRSELWIQPKKFIRANQISGLTRETMHEMVQVEYYERNGRTLRVEAKDDTKKRLGFSPDLGDTFIMLVEKAMLMGHFASEEEKKIVGTDRENWKKIMRRKAPQSGLRRRLRFG